LSKYQAIHVLGDEILTVPDLMKFEAADPFNETFGSEALGRKVSSKRIIPRNHGSVLEFIVGANY